MAAFYVGANHNLLHRPVEIPEAFGPMANSAIHRSPHNCLTEPVSKAPITFRRVPRAESRAEFTLIQILIKPWRAIAPETPVDFFNRRMFARIHAALFRKDWEHSALVTSRAVVVAISQLPTALDADRTAASIGPEIILEVCIECPIAVWNRRNNRKIASAITSPGIGHTELDPLLRNTCFRVSRNDDQQPSITVVVVRSPKMPGGETEIGKSRVRNPCRIDLLQKCFCAIESFPAAYGREEPSIQQEVRNLNEPASLLEILLVRNLKAKFVIGQLVDGRHSHVLDELAMAKDEAVVLV